MVFVRSVKNKVDLFVGIGILVFVCVLFGQTTALADTVRLMPRIAMGIAAAAAIGIIVKSFLKEGEHADAAPTQRIVRISEWTVGAIVVVMLLAIPYVGMYASLFVIITAVSVTLCLLENGIVWKKLLGVLLYDVAVIAVIYLLFHQVLSLQTPRGILL